MLKLVILITLSSVVIAIETKYKEERIKQPNPIITRNGARVSTS
jgi:hypothetical protein